MSTSSAPTFRSRVPLIAGAAIAVVAVAVGLWFLFLRDDAPDALSLSESSTGSGKVVDATGLDGTWTVVTGTGDEATVVGYRVKEEFVAGARKSTAAGRTNDVKGTVTVADGTVTAGSFTADLTTLESDEGRRDNTIRTRGLQTNDFPTGTFELTEPVTLPDLRDGKVVEVEATGELTLHGVTKPVTLTLQVKVAGAAVRIQGSAPVVMADHEIEPPSIGGFVSVSDEGSFEFIVNLEQG